MKTLLALLAVVSASTALAGERPAVRADQKAEFRVGKSNVGVVEDGTADKFVSNANSFLSSKDLKLMGGAEGIKKVGRDGVDVQLTNSKGQTFDAVIQTKVMKLYEYADKADLYPVGQADLHVLQRGIDKQTTEILKSDVTKAELTGLAKP